MSTDTTSPCVLELHDHKPGHVVPGRPTDGGANPDTGQRTPTADPYANVEFTVAFPDPDAPDTQLCATLVGADPLYVGQHDGDTDHLLLTFTVSGRGLWDVQLVVHDTPHTHLTLRHDLHRDGDHDRGHNAPAARALAALHRQLAADLTNPSRLRQLATALDTRAQDAQANPALANQLHLVFDACYAARVVACAAHATTPVVNRTLVDITRGGYEGSLLALVDAVVGATAAAADVTGGQQA